MNNSLLRSVVRIALWAVLPAFLLYPGSALPAPAAPYRVALFPFLPQTGAPSPMDRTVTDIVYDRLTADSSLVLVDPSRLAEIAAGLGLDLDSPLDEKVEQQVAALSDADIMVSGRTRQVDREIAVVARVGGVGNGRSREVLVTSSVMGRIRPLIARLADDISRTIAEGGEGFLSPPASTGIETAELCESLAGKSLPRLYVMVRESYGGTPRESSTSEAQLNLYLKECGFPLTAERKEAEVLVFGRAAGEGSRRGEVVTSRVELELRAVEPTRGILLSVARTERAAADPFASLAGEKAFREAASDIAADFITRLVTEWSVDPRPVP